MAGAIGRTHRSALYVDNANDNMSGYNDVRVGADPCVCPKGATSLVCTPNGLGAVFDTSEASI